MTLMERSNNNNNNNNNNKDNEELQREFDALFKLTEGREPYEWHGRRLSKQEVIKLLEEINDEFETRMSWKAVKKNKEKIRSLRAISFGPVPDFGPIKFGPPPPPKRRTAPTSFA